MDYIRTFFLVDFLRDPYSKREKVKRKEGNIFLAPIVYLGK